MTARKVIVTVAPTGGLLTAAEHPYLPTQPTQIAEDVRRCADAGASVAALHARLPDDGATCDPAIYREIGDLIRQRCDVVINNSTGGGLSGDMVRSTSDGDLLIDLDQRLRGVDGGADTCTLDTITAYVRGPAGDVLMGTPYAWARRLAEHMRERGVKPEWEIFNPAHLAVDLPALSDMDVPPLIVNLVFGQHGLFQNAMPYTPRIMRQMVELLPDGAVFTATVCGPDPVQGLVDAVLLGGHVRVGLEDSPFDRSGRPARNIDQVERIVRILHELGCEPATADEARAILGLPERSA
jgi:3-keto-5-aminohexanoate cleavage enzyme